MAADDITCTIDIKEMQIEGKMVTVCFNPNPIHVGSSVCHLEIVFLQINVELQ